LATYGHAYRPVFRSFIGCGRASLLISAGAGRKLDNDARAEHQNAGVSIYISSHGRSGVHWSAFSRFFA
jgi:hypothetical protein